MSSNFAGEKLFIFLPTRQNVMRNRANSLCADTISPQLAVGMMNPKINEKEKKRKRSSNVWFYIKGSLFSDNENFWFEVSVLVLLEISCMLFRLFKS